MIYLAGGWFNKAQENALEDMELVTVGYDVFSPREGTAHIKDWGMIFTTNTSKIDRCTMVLASTVGKDMGTLFECGYAHAKGKNIVYYSPGLKSDFNLMLAKSGHRVCTTFEQLLEAAKDGFVYKEYTGGIE